MKKKGMTHPAPGLSGGAHRNHECPLTPGALWVLGTLPVSEAKGGLGREKLVAALAHAHLLMTIARMIGNHPNFRIFMMGGLCLATRTHTGIRAVKPIHTSGVRYRLSAGRETGCMPGHMSMASRAMAWVPKMKGGLSTKGTRGLRRQFCPQQLRVDQSNIPLSNLYHLMKQLEKLLFVLNS